MLCEFPMIIIVNVQTCTGGKHGTALHSPSGTVNFLLLLLTYKSVQVASTAQPYIPQVGLCEFSVIIVNVQICTGGEHSSALHSPSGQHKRGGRHDGRGSSGAEPGMDVAGQAPLGGGQAVRLSPPSADHGAAALRQPAGYSGRLRLWCRLHAGLHALHHV